MSSKKYPKEKIESNQSINISYNNKHNINNKIISQKEINTKNEKGYTKIYLSILSNNISSLKELLSLGANPNIPNNLSETPLYLSVKNKNFDAFLLLLKYNADCNISNKDWETPLHIAVQNNEKKFIQNLLKNNANPNLKNLTNGQTATHLAIINKLDKDILKLFKENNADIFYIKDNHNKSAFDYAKNFKDEKYINLLLEIFGYKYNSINFDVTDIIKKNKSKNEKNKHIQNNNIYLNNTDKNKNNLENFQRSQIKEFSNNNDYYIITTETNKNEFKLENYDSNKEDITSNNSLIKNKVILSSDMSSENIQIKELNNTSENNSNNKSKKSLSDFLTEEINIKNNTKENNKNILSQIYSQKSDNSDISKSQLNNPPSHHSDNIKNKTRNIVISHTNSSNVFSHKSNISGNNSINNSHSHCNTNSNIYLTNSVGANKKIIKNIIRDTIKKIIVKSISSSDDNTSKENIILFSKESEQPSHSNSNMEDSKSKNSKNSKNSKMSSNFNQNKENISNNIENNVNNSKINLYENGTNSFLLLKSKNVNEINEILNNDNISVSKLIKDESKTMKLNNAYEDIYKNTRKANDITEESKNKKNKEKTNTNDNIEIINTNLNINEIKDNNIFLETTNSNIFSELQIKSNNNYNITNNDITLSYSKNIITEEDNQFKIENNEDKKIKKTHNYNIDKSNSNSNLDIQLYENITNSNINNNNNRDFKIINNSINKEEESHIRDKSNGNLNSKYNEINKMKFSKSKSFIDYNSIENNNNNQIRLQKNLTLENNNGKNTLLKRKYITNKMKNKSQIYLKHYRHLSYHLNSKPMIYNSLREKNDIKNRKKFINDLNQTNSIYIKENENPNFTTLNNDIIYKNKNHIINAWYKDKDTTKSFKSSIKSKFSNNISGINRTSKFSLNKSGSCQNMNPPPIEAIINRDMISPSHKTISTSNNQNSLINHNINKSNKNKISISNALLNNLAYITTKPKHSSLNKSSNTNSNYNNSKNLPSNYINNNIKTNTSNPFNDNYNDNMVYELDESKYNINYKLNKLKNISTHTLIRLREWLISCDLLCYYNLLISKNMYHIDSYINVLQQGLTTLSFEDFEKIGIKKPGHIFRLLIKLELDAGLIDNNLFSYINDKINYNSVTTTLALSSSQNEVFCCGVNLCPNINNNSNNYYIKKKNRISAIYYNDLSTFLRVHDLIRFKGNFIHNGFDRIEFVIIQLFSKYAFDKKILNEYLHVYIDRDKFKILNVLYMVKYNIGKEFGININDGELDKIINTSQKKMEKNEKYSEYINQNYNDYNNESNINRKNESNHFCNIF